MPADLTDEQTDRAAGVLLGGAVGDALGVPYEFGTPPGPAELAEMTGGGLGNFAPGEWSDDTSMAVAIAEVAATGADLTTAAALDEIARGFLRWYASGPPDIGIQTAEVLRRSAPRWKAARLRGRCCTDEAQAYALDHPRSAGNGALMRTGPVALAHLDDRAQLAPAARLVAQLTHADPLAGDSCVLWCEAIRVAVPEGEIDVRRGLDLVPESRRDQWSAWLDDALDLERNRAEPVPGARFTPNGFTVTALQAAVAAIATHERRRPSPRGRVAQRGADRERHRHRRRDRRARCWVRAGARAPYRCHGARAVHGWPGRTGEDLVELAGRTVSSAAGVAPASSVMKSSQPCSVTSMSRTDQTLAMKLA